MLLTFEKEDQLKSASCENGNLSLSERYFKDGNKSLKWEFKNNSTLYFDVPVGYKRPADNGKDSRVSTFGVYLYNVSPTDDFLNFEFLSKGLTQTSFRVNLNFKGWRSVFVKFDVDMTGSPDEDMHGIKVTAPDFEGALYIDQLVTSNMVDPRSPVASFQVPFVKRDKLTPTGGIAYTYYDYYKLIPCTECNNTDISEKIKQKYIRFVKGNFKKFRKTKDEINNFFNSLNISENRQGKPVEYHAQKEIIANIDYPFEHNPVDLRQYVDLLFGVAYNFLETKDLQMRDIFINMVKHLMEQGLQAGSSMGVLHHIDYSLRMFYPAVLIMEDELKKTGFYNDLIEMIKWISGFGMIFITDNNMDTVSADTFNTQSQSYLILSLMSSSEEYLKQLKNWLDFAMRPTQGLSGLMKEDGSIYHHCGHYTAYGMDGLTGVVPVVYSLSGTKFEISDKAWQLLSKVLKNMRFYVNKYDYPISMSGRHPTGLWKINLDLFRCWALAGICCGDDEPVKIYKRLIEGIEPSLEDMEIVNFNVPAEANPSGHLTMNMACAAFHRRDGFLVSIKGFSKYLWGNETYIANNLYGRYMSYGHLEILKESQRKSGFSQDGFDWARIPGSTAIHYPISKMRSDVYNLDSYSGFEEMLISDKAFAGGVNNGENGIFAMKLQGHPKYDKTHSATISAFFVDDFVLRLGSDISNDEKVYKTNTTLFQKALADDENWFMPDGKIVDNKGNVYYTTSKVTIEKGMQVSQDQSGKGETKGKFCVGYIDHGIAPKNADYEYGIGISGGAKPEYEVLQKDSAAHIVRFGNATYYAIFQPENYNGKGILTKTDNMLLLIAEELKGKVKISVCQPDLGLYNTDESQYVNGERIEVSIYSRKWLYNPVKEHTVNLTLNDKEIEIKAKGGEVINFEL